MRSSSGATIAAEINRSISQCESYSTVAQAILWPLAQRFGASAGAFFQFRTEKGVPLSVEEGIFCGPFTAAAELYRTHLFRNDPLFDAPSAAPILLSDMLARSPRKTRGKLGIDAYRSEFLLQYGIGDIVGIHFSLTCGARTKELAVSFQRPAGACDYAMSDKALLMELAPTLKLALRSLALDAELRAREAAVVNRWGALSAAEPASARVSAAGHGKDDAIFLTTREMDIVDALRAGHSNESMAHALGISIRTVENHLRAIYAKMRVNSRTQLLSKLFRL